MVELQTVIVDSNGGRLALLSAGHSDARLQRLLAGLDYLTSDERADAKRTSGLEVHVRDLDGARVYLAPSYTLGFPAGSKVRLLDLGRWCDTREEALALIESDARERGAAYVVVRCPQIDDVTVWPIGEVSRALD